MCLDTTVQYIIQSWPNRIWIRWEYVFLVSLLYILRPVYSVTKPSSISHMALIIFKLSKSPDHLKDELSYSTYRNIIINLSGCYNMVLSHIIKGP